MVAYRFSKAELFVQPPKVFKKRLLIYMPAPVKAQGQTLWVHEQSLLNSVEPWLQVTQKSAVHSSQIQEFTNKTIW